MCVHKKRGGHAEAKTNLQHAKTTYQKRESERLAPLEVDLARLQQGLLVRKAKFETDIEHHEKLKSQLLERFPRDGGLDGARPGGAETLREWQKLESAHAQEISSSHAQTDQSNKRDT